MGLFGLFKKSRGSESSGPEAADKPARQTGVFKGDLALISCAETFPEKEPEKTGNSIPAHTGENKDSEDSVVFMSFAPVMRKHWICRECGTCNEENLNGCIVCGLRK